MGKANARERILNTAGDLFHEKGYTCVGINEIIDKSETAKATFYNHFPTKEALCDAWLSGIHDRAMARQKAILEADSCPIQKISDYFSGLKSFFEENGYRGCPYSNTGAVTTSGQARLIERIQQHKLSIRTFFRELATGFAGSGTRAREIGDSLFLLYSGASGEAQNLKALWPVEAAEKTAMEICEREKR